MCCQTRQLRWGLEHPLSRWLTWLSSWSPGRWPGLWARGLILVSVSLSMGCLGYLTWWLDSQRTRWKCTQNFMTSSKKSQSITLVIFNWLKLSQRPIWFKRRNRLHLLMGECQVLKDSRLACGVGDTVVVIFGKYKQPHTIIEIEHTETQALWKSMLLNTP